MDWNAIYTKRLAARCQQAASDLGLEVQAPFQLEHDGDITPFVAYFPNFGGPKGLLVTLATQWSALDDIAAKAGFASVGLYPEQFSTYSRDQWVRIIKEWGWHGPEDERPAL